MTAARYEVRLAGRRVLAFSAEPGVLASTAARPPGFQPPPHPFVNAQAFDASQESRLAGLLAEAKTVEDFIGRLRGAGYEVAPAGS